MRPSGLVLFEKGVLEERINTLRKMASVCEICPRNCRVDRLGDQRGFCRTGRFAKVASYNVHRGEEPPISGHSGSGTVFFSNCSLKCVFCQNYPISQLGVGQEVNNRELSDMFLELQHRGCHNLNLVTPTHVVLNILEALRIAYGKGFCLPIVWNTSGYEKVETLKLLDGVVDIYMPDIKYRDRELAKKYSFASDYPDYNGAALVEMYHQVGPLEFGANGVAIRGLLVRHLVLPGHIDDTKRCLEYLANYVSREVAVSLMGQYFPAFHAVEDDNIGRRLSRAEYREAISIMEEVGLISGWYQDF